MFLTTDNLRGLGAVATATAPPAPAPAPVMAAQQPVAPPAAPAPEPVVSNTASIDDKKKLIAAAISDVPWPHAFFRSFITSSPAPFWQGQTISSDAFYGSDFFPATQSKVDRQIALWLIDNQDGLNKHFQTEVQAWAKHQQDILKKKAKKQKIIGIVVGAVGAILSIITGGLLAPIVIALVTTIFSVYQAKKMSADQVKKAKQLNAILGISQAGMEKFRLWIVTNAQRPAEVPPASNTGHQYTIWINSDMFNSSNDLPGLLKASFDASKVGDRIVVKDETSNAISAMYLRESAGLRVIPQDMQATVQALPQDSAVVAAGGGFPTWILIPLVAAAAVTKLK